MSWDSYIDNVMGHATFGNVSHIDKAAVFGTDGNAWSSDAHANALKLSDTERKKIASELAREGNSDFGANGIIAGGVKYQFLRYDEGAVMGKKKGEGAITIQKSKTVILAAHCPEGGQQGNCNTAVSKVVDYLASVGY